MLKAGRKIKRIVIDISYEHSEVLPNGGHVLEIVQFRPMDEQQFVEWLAGGVGTYSIGDDLVGGEIWIDLGLAEGLRGRLIISREKANNETEN